MVLNKFPNFGYLAVIVIVLGITMSMAIVKADSSLQNNNDGTVLKINEELNTHQEYEQTEKNVEEDGSSVEELKELEEYDISIEGMTCANCEVKVKEALLKCSGVKTAWVSYIDANAVIEVNVDMIDGNEIIAAIEKAGFSYVEEE